MKTAINFRHKFKSANGFSQGYINSFVPQLPLTKTIICLKKCLRVHCRKSFVDLKYFYKKPDRDKFTFPTRVILSVH
jgi:hypothetical protein